jgi:negative regulator of genetic competence ClpC/MecB
MKKFEKDLEAVLLLCEEFAKSNKLKYITVDNFVYNLLNFYFRGGKFSDLDPKLDLRFMCIPAEKKAELLKKLKDLAENNGKIDPNEESVFNLEDGITLEDSLNVSFDFVTKEVESKGNIQSRDLLLSCLDLADFEGSVRLIKEYGINSEFLNIPEQLKEKRIDYSSPDFSINNKLTEKDDSEFEAWGTNEAINVADVDPDSKTPILDSFSRDMTREAINKKFDPVIGRDDVVDSIIEILCKRRKPNVSITGKAGVGKSAIVERLAQRIASKQVPLDLVGKRICSLNLNDLVAGTKFRGEYEERLKNIIKEVCDNKDIIVYIDELHNLVGNGGQNGNGDAANILKPYLARGEFQCIGSTTDEEYRKFIEKDAALNRRFTQVSIKEPTVDETIKILNGVKSKYEDFHKVKIDKDVIEACARWSQRYISGKQQPDKAIEVLDMAGAVVKQKKVVDNTALDGLEKKLNEAISKKVDLVLKSKEAGDFEEAERLQAEENKLKEELEIENSKKARERSLKKNWPSITLDDVASSISKISRVPIDSIRKTDREKLREMKKSLESKVIGQQNAIDTVTNVINQNVLGLRADHRRPLGSFLLVGPSGVGKSLICKELANTFYGSEDNLIRIDGNTLKDDTSANSLIGVAAGYIGFDSEPQLLQVKRKPNSVILVDEVEKMNPKIFDIFLTILDEGKVKLADATTEIDFSSSIIIFTGNIGTRELAGDVNIGFNKLGRDEKQKRNESIVSNAIKNTFRPEFIGRLSSIVIFNELGTEELSKIFDIEYKKIKTQFTGNKLKVNVTKEFKDYIIKLCDHKYGARDLRRNLEKNLITPISNYMIENIESNRFNVTYKNDKVVVSSPDKVEVEKV